MEARMASATGPVRAARQSNGQRRRNPAARSPVEPGWIPLQRLGFRPVRGTLMIGRCAGWAAMLTLAACAEKQVLPTPAEKTPEPKVASTAPAAGTPAPQPAPAATAVNYDE